jgi:hypothetical protein
VLEVGQAAHHLRPRRIGKVDLERHATRAAVLLDAERPDAAARALDHVEDAARRPAGEIDDEPPVDLAVALEEAVGDDPQRPEDDDDDRRREDRSAVVAGARGDPDGGGRPQGRGGREAADGEALPDDRARTEEADPADDLRGDARRVVDDAAGPRVREVGERVRGDDREEGGADRDEQVRPQAGLALPQLALEPDRSPERRGGREPEEDVCPVELREQPAPPPAPCRSA